MIYKNACKLLNDKVSIAESLDGSVLCISMDRISKALKTAALYGLDPVLLNEENTFGKSPVIPRVSSHFI